MHGYKKLIFLTRKKEKEMKRTQYYMETIQNTSLNPVNNINTTTHIRCGYVAEFHIEYGITKSGEYTSHLGVDRNSITIICSKREEFYSIRENYDREYRKNGKCIENTHNITYEYSNLLAVQLHIQRWYENNHGEKRFYMMYIDTDSQDANNTPDLMLYSANKYNKEIFDKKIQENLTVFNSLISCQVEQKIIETVITQQPVILSPNKLLNNSS